MFLTLIMQRYNPHLDPITRRYVPPYISPRLESEKKENIPFLRGLSMNVFRDGYIYNSPSSNWRKKNGRTYFAVLNYKKEFDKIIVNATSE